MTSLTKGTGLPFLTQETWLRSPLDSPSRDRLDAGARSFRTGLDGGSALAHRDGTLLAVGPDGAGTVSSPPHTAAGTGTAVAPARSGRAGAVHGPGWTRRPGGATATYIRPKKR